MKIRFLRFPIPTDIQDNSGEYYLSNNDILSIYNDGLEKSDCVNSIVIQWIELESMRWGWKSIRWSMQDNLRQCFLRTHTESFPTVKYCQEVLINQCILEVLTSSITRVAQHACRQGEISSRVWPALSSLPEPKGWECVGKQYAKEIALKIEEKYFSQETFFNEIITAKKE